MKTATLVWMAAGEVYHREDDNVSRVTHFRDEADKVRLASLFVPPEEGWLPNLGVINVYRPEEAKFLAYVEDALKARLEIRERISKSTEDVRLQVEGVNVTVTPSDRLRVFDQLYMVKGKPVAPKYFGVNGFRRTSADVFILANAARMKLGKSLITELPTYFKAYASDVERYEDCIRENSLKMTGAWALSFADALKSTINILTCGGTQSTLRRLFKDGPGQKLFAIFELDRLYRKLHIIERIISGEFPYGPIMATEIRKNLVNIDDPKDWKIKADPKDVETYLTDPKKGGKKNDPKIAAKDEMTNVKLRHRSIVVRVSFKAVLENNLGSLAPLSHEEFCKEEEALLKKHNITLVE